MGTFIFLLPPVSTRQPALLGLCLKSKEDNYILQYKRLVSGYLFLDLLYDYNYTKQGIKQLVTQTYFESCFISCYLKCCHLLLYSHDQFIL